MVVNGGRAYGYGSQWRQWTQWNCGLTHSGGSGITASGGMDCTHCGGFGITHNGSLGFTHGRNFGPKWGGAQNFNPKGLNNTHGRKIFYF